MIDYIDIYFRGASVCIGIMHSLLYLGGQKMRKLFTPALLLLAVCIACFSGCSVLENIVGEHGGYTQIIDGANSEPSVGLEFAVDNDGACYVKGIGSCTDVNIVIPQKSPDGKTITKIGNKAFSGKSEIKTVYIPDGVTSIGTSAFSNCTSLADISIPESVTSIGANAFFNCPDITSITIPEGVTSISASMFYKCVSLASVTIPGTVKTIEASAFSTCTRLESVTIPSSVQAIKTDAFYGCGNLKKVYISDIAKWCNISFADYSANPLSNACELYLNGERVTDLVIPGDVASVKKYAFYNCRGISNVTISKGTTTIEDFAFFGVEDIKTVNISSSVKIISNSAFAFCKGLENISVDKQNTAFSSNDGSMYTADGTKILQYALGKEEASFNIPDTVTSISDYAFAGASDLNEVIIPNSVVSIGNNAFSQCGKISGISIPNSVKTIGDYAFFNCSNLDKISLPNNLVSIGLGAFEGCRGVEYDGAYYIGNSENPYVLLLGVADKSIKSYRLMDGTQFVHSGAFWGCNSLEKVVFPESVKSVGNCAFIYCNSLKYVRFVGSKQEWEKISFGSDNEKLTGASYVTFDYNGD